MPPYSQSSAGSWQQGRSEQEIAEQIELIALPFAGGNSYSFRPLDQVLPDRITLRPVELPGRGRRMREPLLDSIEALAQDALGQIEAGLGERPYAIYGHSMGGVIAYQLVHAIISCGLPKPLRLMVSGCRAPHLVSRAEGRHLLAREQFYDMLERMGGLPIEVRANSELMELFEPILRADFAAVDNYLHRPKIALDLPLDILIGDDDHEVTESEWRDWQRESVGQVTFHRFSGGHFFINSESAAVAEVIGNQLLEPGQ